MAAGIGDLFKRTYNSGNPNVARVTSTRSALGTSLSCDNLAGWPTLTAVDFSTYKIDTSNNVIAGTQIDWKGLVSGNTIGTLTRITGASDTGSAIGDVVEMNPTGNWGNDLMSGILAEHLQTGVHTLTSSSTLTSSKVITALNDTNGNELFKVTPTASAVNEITIANAATGAGPTLSATGGDTNIDFNLATKGTGAFKLNGNTLNPGASVSYTPTWTGVTIGNATVDARYILQGKLCTVTLSYVQGSTTSVTSQILFSLPFTAATRYTGTTGGQYMIGTAYMEDAGVSSYSGYIKVNTTTTGALIAPGSAGANITGVNATNTIPFTWGTGDLFASTFTYEIA